MKFLKLLAGSLGVTTLAALLSSGVAAKSAISVDASNAAYKPPVKRLVLDYGQTVKARIADDAVCGHYSHTSHVSHRSHYSSR